MIATQLLWLRWCELHATALTVICARREPADTLMRWPREIAAWTEGMSEMEKLVISNRAFDEQHGDLIAFLRSSTEALVRAYQRSEVRIDLLDEWCAP